MSTSLLLNARLAGLPPTLECEPSSGGALSSDVEAEARQVLEWAGLFLDDWQESFLFEALRQRSDGIWSAFEVACVVPRQNGKGAILEARQLIGLFVLAERLQVHTAHEFKTCGEHFLRIKSLIESSDELWEQVRIIRTGAGEQAIELKTGERLRFLARSRSSGRGFSADAVYFDEAFELPITSVGAVMPTLSARPNPQVWYCSSAPHFTSDYLHALLKRAADESGRRLFVRAWENDPDVRLDDVEAWRRVTPALGIRISEEFIDGEMRSLCATPEGIAEFRRERLGIREGGDGESGVVPFDQWSRLDDRDSRVASSLMYGVSVTPDGSVSSLSSCGRRSDGLLHVDTVERRKGTAWVIPHVVDLWERKRIPIRLDPSGPEGAFVRELRDRGVEVFEVPSRDYQQACAEFLAAVINGELRHLDQESMSMSAAVAGKRDIGKEGGWVWAHPPGVDISPLKAATIALTGVVRRDKPGIW